MHLPPTRCRVALLLPSLLLAPAPRAPAAPATQPTLVTQPAPLTRPAAVARPAGAVTTDPQWRPLFNGRDLAGWRVVGTAAWRVEDGVIVGTQDGEPKRAGLLTTADAYQDFELELEFRLDEHGKYNSGVHLRNDPAAADRTGYQVNIGRGAAGEYCGGLFLTDWLAKGDEKDTIRKPREWNTMRIAARGGHIVVDLNGVNVVDYTDPAPDPKLLRPGVLALQTYGAEGHAGWVHFRHLRLRDLGTAGGTGGEDAPPATRPE